MSKEPNNTTNEYKTLKADAPLVRKTIKKEDRPGWLRRKYLKLKGAAGEFWVVGRYGFQLGGAAGLILGFLVGGFESIRMKSIWPLPLAMIGSGFTFGCIFAISTVLRSEEDLISEDGFKKFSYEIVYFDKLDGKYKKTSFPMSNSFENRKL